MIPYLCLRGLDGAADLLDRVERLKIIDRFNKHREVKRFGEAIERSKTLVELEIRCVFLGLERALEKNTSIRDLRLRDCHFHSPSRLAGVIKNKSSLQRIDIFHCQGDVVNLIRAITANRCIKEVALDNVCIGPENALIVSDLISAPGLRSLSLRLTWSSTKAAAEGLKSKGCTLESLHFGYNNSFHEGLKELGEALKTNTTLTSLNLCNNELRDKDAIHLAGSRLKYLGLSSNHITDVGSFGDSIETLILAKNHSINDDSMKTICYPKLHTIDLTSDELISAVGLQCLLKNCPLIRNLFVSSNAWNDDFFYEYLRSDSCQLNYLQIHGRVDDDHRLIDALKINISLRSFHSHFTIPAIREVLYMNWTLLECEAGPSVEYELAMNKAGTWDEVKKLRRVQYMKLAWKPVWIVNRQFPQCILRSIEALLFCHGIEDRDLLISHVVPEFVFSELKLSL